MSQRPLIPRNVWVLGLVSLFTDISSEMIHSILPLFLVTVLDASLPMVGIIEGVAEATASVLKVFSGALSDYLGHRKGLTIVGYGLSAVVKPLFALATSPTWVLMARFGDRFGKGIRVAPRDALVADSTTVENRGAAYGLRQSLDTTGAFLGPLLTFGLMWLSGQNYRLVFQLAVIPAFLAVTLLALGIREPQRNAYQHQALDFRKGLKELGQRYWLLAAVAMIFNLGNSSDAFLLLQAQQIGISPAWIPIMLVVMNVAYSLTAYPLGHLSDRMGRYGLLITSFGLYALVYLGFGFAQASWQIWILFAFYGLYLGMSQGVLLACVADQVPANLRGTAFGLINLGSGIALLPASLLAGYLWQSVGAEATFSIGSFFALVSALMLLLVKKIRD